MSAEEKGGPCFQISTLTTSQPSPARNVLLPGHAAGNH